MRNGPFLASFPSQNSQRVLREAWQLWIKPWPKSLARAESAAGSKRQLFSPSLLHWHCSGVTALSLLFGKSWWKSNFSVYGKAQAMAPSPRQAKPFSSFQLGRKKKKEGNLGLITQLSFGANYSVIRFKCLVSSRKKVEKNVMCFEAETERPSSHTDPSLLLLGGKKKMKGKMCLFL